MNILTFDIEDWFHIEFNNAISKWDNYQSRLERNMDFIFSSLERTGQKATFFCLGWIAERYPKIIGDISNRGYEIGSHTYDHKLVFKKSRTEFTEDFNRSIKAIEDCTGKKVESFRAPAYSITEDTLWVFEVLCKYGIKYDSSIFPIRRDYGGFPSFTPARPVILDYNGIRLKEFPMNIGILFGRPIVFTGGGYFRLLPYFLIKKMAKKSEYMMVYMHPRDFDKDQPMLENLPPIRKFKSYVGLKSCFIKFNKLLDDFNFVDISQADKEIEWDESDVIKLEEKNKDRY